MVLVGMFFLHRKETRLATRAFTERRVQIRAPDEREDAEPVRQARRCSSSTFRMAKQKGPLFYTATLGSDCPVRWLIIRRSGTESDRPEPRAAHDTQAVRRTQRTCVTWPGPGCTCACKSERRRLVDTPNFVAGGSH